MLTRRTFIKSTGTLAAAAASGMALTESGIKEHGIVEIRFRFLAKDPCVVKSTIFTDERRGIFGIRILGNNDPGDARLGEFRLSDIRETVAAPGHVRKGNCAVWDCNGRKKEEALHLLAMDGNLMFAVPGVDIIETPVWMSLADVQRVL